MHSARTIWWDGSGKWRCMSIINNNNKGAFHRPMIKVCHKLKSIINLSLFLKAIVTKTNVLS